MWKTNKWVPEWVIRHAITRLEPGPRLLQVCKHKSRDSTVLRYGSPREKAIPQMDRFTLNCVQSLTYGPSSLKLNNRG